MPTDKSSAHPTSPLVLSTSDVHALATALAPLFRAAGLVVPGWQPVATAPRDDTPCLFFAPANPHAGNENGRRPRMRVDAFSADWPRARYQLPEAPYTHWKPLPEPPHD